MPLILLITAVLGLGLGASTAYLLTWAFLPDAVDLQPGHPAGLITAFMVQIQELGSAFSVFALGLLLSWSGYVAALGTQQPPQPTGDDSFVHGACSSPADRDSPLVDEGLGSPTHAIKRALSSSAALGLNPITTMSTPAPELGFQA